MGLGKQVVSIEKANHINCNKISGYWNRVTKSTRIIMVMIEIGKRRILFQSIHDKLYKQS